MSSVAKKRILKEYAECSNDLPSGMKVIFDEANLTKWDVVMEGPAESPYAVCLELAMCFDKRSLMHQGGHFKLEINFPNDYPFKPPVVNFKTKVYHPNVSNDDKGSMCLGMLRPEEWKPPNKVISVLHLIQNLLVEPNIDDAIETSIANDYKTNRAEFNKTAQDWVKRYAK
ncbi:UBC-like protein [Sporormia fimetaria CBS 119925]|uniref:E2 ubiquitin-conjugating enzyme n=1 Tax=Sporormia fimetaria CBS 119925 TaxID=1340428 RepID=A0A6A6VFG7_9PLEO|nr:UBC-like protein [Sporormia fimetaria CBS 119925]